MSTSHTNNNKKKPTNKHPLTIKSHQHAHTLPQTYLDPLTKHQHHPPLIFLELHPPQLIPQHQPKLPTNRASERQSNPNTAILPHHITQTRNIRQHLSNNNKPKQQPTDLLHQPIHQKPRDINNPAHHLPHCHHHHNQTKQTHQYLLQTTTPSKNIPTRPAQQSHQHRQLHNIILHRHSTTNLIHNHINPVNCNTKQTWHLNQCHTTDHNNADVQLPTSTQQKHLLITILQNVHQPKPKSKLRHQLNNQHQQHTTPETRCNNLTKKPQIVLPTNLSRDSTHT